MVYLYLIVGFLLPVLQVQPEHFGMRFGFQKVYFGIVLRDAAVERHAVQVQMRAGLQVGLDMVENLATVAHVLHLYEFQTGFRLQMDFGQGVGQDIGLGMAVGAVHQAQGRPFLQQHQAMGLQKKRLVAQAEVHNLQRLVQMAAGGQIHHQGFRGKLAVESGKRQGVGFAAGLGEIGGAANLAALRFGFFFGKKRLYPFAFGRGKVFEAAYAGRVAQGGFLIGKKQVPAGRSRHKTVAHRNAVRV